MNFGNPPKNPVKVGSALNTQYQNNGYEPLSQNLAPNSFYEAIGATEVGNLQTVLGELAPVMKPYIVQASNQRRPGDEKDGVIYVFWDKKQDALCFSTKDHDSKHLSLDFKQIKNTDLNPNFTLKHWCKGIKNNVYKSIEDNTIQSVTVEKIVDKADKAGLTPESVKREAIQKVLKTLKLTNGTSVDTKNFQTYIGQSQARSVYPEPAILSAYAYLKNIKLNLWQKTAIKKSIRRVTDSSQYVTPYALGSDFEERDILVSEVGNNAPVHFQAVKLHASSPEELAQMRGSEEIPEYVPVPKKVPRQGYLSDRVVGAFVDEESADFKAFLENLWKETVSGRFRYIIEYLEKIGAPVDLIEEVRQRSLRDSESFGKFLETVVSKIQEKFSKKFEAETQERGKLPTGNANISSPKPSVQNKNETEKFDASQEMENAPSEMLVEKSMPENQQSDQEVDVSGTSQEKTNITTSFQKSEQPQAPHQFTAVLQLLSVIGTNSADPNRIVLGEAMQKRIVLRDETNPVIRNKAGAELVALQFRLNDFYPNQGKLIRDFIAEVGRNFSITDKMSINELEINEVLRLKKLKENESRANSSAATSSPVLSSSLPSSYQANVEKSYSEDDSDDIDISEQPPLSSTTATPTVSSNVSFSSTADTNENVSLSTALKKRPETQEKIQELIHSWNGIATAIPSWKKTVQNYEKTVNAMSYLLSDGKKAQFDVDLLAFNKFLDGELSEFVEKELQELISASHDDIEVADQRLDTWNDNFQQMHKKLYSMDFKVMKEVIDLDESLAFENQQEDDEEFSVDYASEEEQDDEIESSKVKDEKKVQSHPSFDDADELNISEPSKKSKTEDLRNVELLHRFIKEKKHYDLLNVSNKASSDEIKKAYRGLVLVWHPDKRIGDTTDAQAIFQGVKDAYDLLSDKERKRKYDAGLPDFEEASEERAAKDEAQFRNPASSSFYRKPQKTETTKLDAEKEQEYKKLISKIVEAIDEKNENFPDLFQYISTPNRSERNQFFSKVKTYLTNNSQNKTLSNTIPKVEGYLRKIGRPERLSDGVWNLLQKKFAAKIQEAKKSASSTFTPRKDQLPDAARVTPNNKTSKNSATSSQRKDEATTEPPVTPKKPAVLTQLTPNKPKSNTAPAVTPPKNTNKTPSAGTSNLPPIPRQKERKEKAVSTKNVNNSIDSSATLNDSNQQNNALNTPHSESIKPVETAIFSENDDDNTTTSTKNIFSLSAVDTTNEANKNDDASSVNSNAASTSSFNSTRVMRPFETKEEKVQELIGSWGDIVHKISLCKKNIQSYQNNVNESTQLYFLNEEKKAQLNVYSSGFDKQLKSLEELERLAEEKRQKLNDVAQGKIKYPSLLELIPLKPTSKENKQNDQKLESINKTILQLNTEFTQFLAELQSLADSSKTAVVPDNEETPLNSDSSIIVENEVISPSDAVATISDESDRLSVMEPIEQIFNDNAPENFEKTIEENDASIQPDNQSNIEFAEDVPTLDSNMTSSDRNEAATRSPREEANAAQEKEPQIIRPDIESPSQLYNIWQKWQTIHQEINVCNETINLLRHTYLEPVINTPSNALSVKEKQNEFKAISDRLNTLIDGALKSLTLDVTYNQKVLLELVQQIDRVENVALLDAQFQLGQTKLDSIVKNLAEIEDELKKLLVEPIDEAEQVDAEDDNVSLSDDEELELQFHHVYGNGDNEAFNSQDDYDPAQFRKSESSSPNSVEEIKQQSDDEVIPVVSVVSTNDEILSSGPDLSDEIEAAREKEKQEILAALEVLTQLWQKMQETIIECRRDVDLLKKTDIDPRLIMKSSVVSKEQKQLSIINTELTKLDDELILLTSTVQKNQNELENFAQKINSNNLSSDTTSLNSEFQLREAELENIVKDLAEIEAGLQKLLTEPAVPVQIEKSTPDLLKSKSAGRGKFNSTAAAQVSSKEIPSGLFEDIVTIYHPNKNEEPQKITKDTVDQVGVGEKIVLLNNPLARMSVTIPASNPNPVVNPVTPQKTDAKPRKSVLVQKEEVRHPLLEDVYGSEEDRLGMDRSPLQSMQENPLSRLPSPTISRSSANRNTAILSPEEEQALRKCGCLNAMGMMAGMFTLPEGVANFSLLSRVRAVTENREIEMRLIDDSLDLDYSNYLGGSTETEEIRTEHVMNPIRQTPVKQKTNSVTENHEIAIESISSNDDSLDLGYSHYPGGEVDSEVDARRTLDFMNPIRQTLVVNEMGERQSQESERSVLTEDSEEENRTMLRAGQCVGITCAAMAGVALSPIIGLAMAGRYLSSVREEHQQAQRDNTIDTQQQEIDRLHAQLQALQQQSTLTQRSSSVVSVERGMVDVDERLKKLEKLSFSGDLLNTLEGNVNKALWNFMRYCKIDDDQLISRGFAQKYGPYSKKNGGATVERLQAISHLLEKPCPKESIELAEALKDSISSLLIYVTHNEQKWKNSRKILDDSVVLISDPVFEDPDGRYSKMYEEKNKQYTKLNTYWQKVFGPLDKTLSKKEDEENLIDDYFKLTESEEPKQGAQLLQKLMVQIELASKYRITPPYKIKAIVCPEKEWKQVLEKWTRNKWEHTDQPHWKVQITRDQDTGKNSGSRLPRVGEVAVRTRYTAQDDVLASAYTEIGGVRVEGFLAGDESKPEVRQIHAETILEAMTKALSQFLENNDQRWPSEKNKIKIFPSDDRCMVYMMGALLSLGVNYDGIRDMTNVCRRNDVPRPDYMPEKIYSKIANLTHSNNTFSIKQVNLKSSNSWMVKEFSDDLLGGKNAANNYKTSQAIPKIMEAIQVIQDKEDARRGLKAAIMNKKEVNTIVEKKITKMESKASVNFGSPAA